MGCICAVGGGGGVPLTPFRGSLSITAGTAIVEVLVGWSPASPQKRPGVLADFLHDKKKRMPQDLRMQSRRCSRRKTRPCGKSLGEWRWTRPRIIFGAAAPLSGSSIIKAIEERFGDRRHSREAQARQDSVASARTNSTTQLQLLQRERQDEEWKVVGPRKKGRKKEEVKKITERAVESQVYVASSATDAQAGRRTKGTPKPRAAASTGTSMKTPKCVLVQTPKKVVLLRSPRWSAVTLTLGEGAKMSYAEVLASTNPASRGWHRGG